MIYEFEWKMIITKKPLFYTMKIFLALSVIFLLIPLNSFGQAPEIPDWVRNNAKWWSTSQISDQDFVKGLEYMIQKGVIKIPQTEQTNSDTSEQIPSWLRKNAGWWSQGLLSDEEFVKSIQYLINKGIIRISQPQIICSGESLCITAKVEKIVDGDTIYIEGYKVRLSLTNTPETGEVGFVEATEFTKNSCPIGSTVIVDQDDRQPYDTYGRLLGKVYCDGKLLNSELLYNGHANILTQYCLTSEFSGEAWAQKYGCGMKATEVKQQTPKESQASSDTAQSTVLRLFGIRYPVNEGDPLVFVGILSTKEGISVQGAKITITHDGMCTNKTIGYGTTDKLGRFWILTTAKVWDQKDNMIKVQAEFSGQKGLRGAISESEIIRIYPVQNKLC
jgi:endonuclease YncB( thermonuclease family)